MHQRDSPVDDQYPEPVPAAEPRSGRAPRCPQIYRTKNVPRRGAENAGAARQRAWLTRLTRLTQSRPVLLAPFEEIDSQISIEDEPEANRNSKTPGDGWGGRGNGKGRGKGKVMGRKNGKGAGKGKGKGKGKGEGGSGGEGGGGGGNGPTQGSSP